MLASGITREALEQAAASVGVSVSVSTLNRKGTRHRVKVSPGTPPPSVWQMDPKRSRLCPVCGEKVKVEGETTDGRLIGTCGDAAPVERWAGGRRWKDERGDAPYQRVSASMWRNERRVAAVCWHGFRDFFWACYDLAPDAVFRTAMDTWRGAEDFEVRYRASGHHNIGSRVAPVAACEACRCGEQGWAR